MRCEDSRDLHDRRTRHPENRRPEAETSAVVVVGLVDHVLLVVMPLGRFEGGRQRVGRQLEAARRTFFEHASEMLMPPTLPVELLGEILDVRPEPTELSGELVVLGPSVPGSKRFPTEAELAGRSVVVHRRSVQHGLSPS